MVNLTQSILVTASLILLIGMMSLLTWLVRMLMKLLGTIICSIATIHQNHVQSDTMFVGKLQHRGRTSGTTYHVNASKNRSLDRVRVVCSSRMSDLVNAFPIKDREALQKHKQKRKTMSIRKQRNHAPARVWKIFTLKLSLSWRKRVMRWRLGCILMPFQGDHDSGDTLPEGAGVMD
jgi:hypothetical protein